jgi:hypothetical protein
MMTAKENLKKEMFFYCILTFMSSQFFPIKPETGDTFMVFLQNGQISA